MPKGLIVKSYPTLLSQLKKVFIEGLQRIEEEKVRTYWRTGQLISEFILQNKQRADYGDNLFKRLEKDLDIHHRTLERTVKFYRTFPIASAQTQLTWMHFRQLITIEDKSKRELFAEKAAKKGWGYRELEEAIRLDKLKIDEPKEKPSSSSAKLSVTRSRLYTYQVLEPTYIHPIEEYLTIDLGFNTLIHTEIKNLRLKAGELIESTKTGQTYAFKRSDAKPKELYTYIALVERVIDADTIWLNIDLGFSCWSRQKVRLRDIDTPELSTKKGLEAKAFVEAKLKEVSFVVVKTYKDDKYGRYLTDVFYSKDEESCQAVLSEGVFLNQELLDLGLAVVMEE